MKTFEVPFSALYCAKRRSGKSMLAEYMVNLLLDHKRIDKVYIFSKTCSYPGNWSTIHDKYKFCNLDFDFIYKMMEFQSKSVMKSKNKKNDDKKKIQEICLVFDDIIDSREDGKKALNPFVSLLEDLYTTGRHIHISVMVLHQYIKHIITPAIRGNIDYMFISSNADEVLEYIKKIVIFKGSNSDFVDYINSRTNDNHFVMYDNVSKNNESRYYIIKANKNYLDSKKI